MVLVKHWGWGLEKTVQKKCELCVVSSFKTSFKGKHFITGDLRELNLKYIHKTSLNFMWCTQILYNGNTFIIYVPIRTLKYRHVYKNSMCWHIIVKLREEAKEHNSRKNSYNSCWIKKENRINEENCNV